MTDSSKEVIREPYIHYLVWFQKGQEYIRALLDNSSKVNAINFTFTQKLGLNNWKTNVRAQKIDGSTLETFGMIIIDF